MSNLVTDANTLRTRFIDAVLTAYPDLFVVYDNQPDTPLPANDMWCRFYVRPGSKSRIQSGQTKKYRQLGIAGLQIMVPAQIGDADGLALADAMDTAFKEWRSADGAMTVYRIETQVTPSNDREECFIIDVTAFYQSDRT